MKRAIACTLLSLFVTSVASAEPIKPTAPLAPTAKLPLKPLKPVKLQCPDLAASVDFSIAMKTSQFAGRVDIVGKVKNVGGAAYESGPNQQTVLLYEIVPGAQPRLVARQAFQNLAPGAEVSLTYRRSWDASSPAEGEFPPSYKLVISYDPDIRLDGNTKNDDCNPSNDVRERSGADINAMFRVR
jgi:hypothetical protein